MLVRIIFSNDIGMGHIGPVEMDELPEIGDTMYHAEQGPFPESVVMHILHRGPPPHMRLAIERIYGPEGYDGLPVIVCAVPDGWQPAPEDTAILH